MELPVVDLSPYLEMICGNGELMEETVVVRLQQCEEVSGALRETGALLVKDPRCSAADNDRFLDMMESYFQKSSDFKLVQQRPDIHYQVGVTPEGVEFPRSLLDEKMKQNIRMMPKEFQPTTPVGPDPKWRYMWRVLSPQDTNTHFQAKNVVPEGFPHWKETMDFWGGKMIAAIEVVAEMAAIGFGLPKHAFTSLMKQGPHLLGPTGSDLDLERYGHEGTVLAGYHYDLNFLSIHGRCRFPGLNIWLRNGQKVQVNVPIGCLLIQSGKELEWLTGGECLACMHEVVVNDRMIHAINLAKQQKNCSLWRVSSTLFAHIAFDAVLKPVGHFAESPLAGNYQPISARDFVEQEIADIQGYK